MKPSDYIRNIINSDRLRYGIDDSSGVTVAEQIARENSKLIDAIVKFLDNEYDIALAKKAGNYYPENRDTTPQSKVGN